MASESVDISQRTICRNLIKGNLKYYYRMKAPKYTDNQLEQVPRKFRQLHRKFKGASKVIVMNDENISHFQTRQSRLMVVFTRIIMKT